MAILLTEQGHQTRASMLHALRAPRHDALLEVILAAVKRPVFAEAATESANWPADAFVAEVVRRQWRRLRRGIYWVIRRPMQTCTGFGSRDWFYTIPAELLISAGGPFGCAAVDCQECRQRIREFFL